MPEKISLSQRVLEIVKVKGPVIPTQVSSEVGTNSLFASAVLSELVSGSHLRISSVKVGGSPVYYAPGQEVKLQNYIKYLHEKERKAYELLRVELVLRDKVLEPVVRVALRQIKDFAVPVQVNGPDGVELFWRWYLIGNEQAEPKVRKLLGMEPDVPQVIERPVEQQVQIPHAVVQQVKEVKRQRRAASPVNSAFVGNVMEYLGKGGIEVLQRCDSGKRRGEVELLVSVPSPVGSVRFYCMSKDKKVCNEADLSTAFVQGQSRGLPVLFLSSGKFTKRASEMLGREFSSIRVLKL
ncbi:hypothetical protein HYU12_03440 [Candidatus Woesearchaeota archaeon]|nr:hypothetical protein [Candidatus Woesearchaeota archaeon]